ncbi:hypothetical protein AMECASPLE_015479, partial [Ameca splendens]
NAMVSFKELCGLTPAANMKQCILTVSMWLINSERSLKVTVDLSETYPTMEAQGPVPELLRKVLNAYDMMIQTSKTLIESADVVYSKLTQAQRAGLDFHEDLHRIGVKEGLKGRKLQKAMESYAWNITVLKLHKLPFRLYFDSDRKISAVMADDVFCTFLSLLVPLSKENQKQRDKKGSFEANVKPIEVLL